jgi:beta-N-acetylhexosaminidase
VSPELERYRRLVVLAFAVLVLLLAGVAAADALFGDNEESGRPVPEAGGGGQRVESTSFLAKIVPPEPDRPTAASPRVPRSVAELVRRLPLERKVAQLLLVGFRGTDFNAAVFRQLRRLDYGGIVIDAANYTGPELLGGLAGEAVVISQQERHVPPWVMAAQEGGAYNVFPDLPPARAPSELGTAEDAAVDAGAAGTTLRALGLTGLLGPVVDVGLETDPALGPRAFSDDPSLVAGFADATVSAYRKAGMFAAVKHFPGLGTASQPTEEGPAQVGQSVEELARRDLIPFRAAFEVGAPGVVLSHALYAVDDFTVPGSLSKQVATDLLRGQLRFRGVAITDDLADPAISAFASVPEAAVRALRAGADMLYISGPAGDQQSAYVALLRAARGSDELRGRVDQAVGRILLAKQEYGLIQRERRR